jgi:hypothetical protein
LIALALLKKEVMYMDDSKKISKVDESSKQFIMEMLGDNQTHGIDVDCVYFKGDKSWLIMEFLKCDTVDPFDSHPNRYAKNWKKFATLFEIAKGLKGELWLVNYSFEVKWKNNVKLLKVKNVDIGAVKAAPTLFNTYVNYLIADEEQMELDKFKQIFNDINNNAQGAWEN